MASNARARELGGELYGVRRTKGLTMRQVADKAGWSESKVSRTEAGRTIISEQDVIVFLTICGVIGPEFTRILALARRSGDSGWLRPSNSERLEELRSLITLEAAAETIASYETNLVPGLLQTEEYIKLLYRKDSPLTEDLIDHRVQSRLGRQDLLKRWDPPQCTFYINERVFYRRDLAEVMHEQALHLVFMSSRPQCVVRILPESTESVGTVGSAFRVTRYKGSPSVVYVPTETFGLFLEGNPHVARYEEILKALDQKALDARESRTWLADLASMFDRVEASPDETSDLAKK